jgi:branched-chain amino acid transport system permease protein
MSIIPQLIANSIIAGGIYALIALGFNLIYGATKFFNLAHGAIATIGGYAVFYLTKSLGLDTILSVIIGVLFAGFVGYLLEIFLFKKLRARKASQMVLLVASLGALTALQAVVAILFTSQFQTLSVGITKTFTIFGGIYTFTQIIIISLALLAMLLLGVAMRYTKFGKAVVAISDEEEVAKVSGINTDKIIAKLFFIGSAVAGLAGILIGFDTGLEPTMGMNILLKGVIASIIGGIGNVYGGVLGAFLLGFVENFGIWKISGEWKDAIAFIVLIIFLVFRPQGILKK